MSSSLVWAASGQVTGARIWDAPERTRVVFDLDGPAQYRLLTLGSPERVVIDLPNAAASRRSAEVTRGKGYVDRIRTGIRNGDDLRVVLDVNSNVQPKAFVLQPNEQYGHRLVIDLEAGIFEAPPMRAETEADIKETPDTLAAAAAAAVTEPSVQDSPSSAAVSSAREPRRSKPTYTYAPKKFIVAVDAGHGGEDPGAIGPRGTYEKQVVMSIAKRLARLIDDQPGMSAVLTRDGDYYVGLRERIEKARAARADLFISIHADAARDRRAHGASVYVLSDRGASSEHARWLAQRENEADLVGGVKLKGKDDTLASFMLDLTQGASIEASFDIGNRLLARLRGLGGHMHKNEVQQAGFLVLKSPDIPSVLVETAFISNADEERKLRSSRHQNRLAAALLEGIQGYVASYRPAGSIVSSGYTHRVKSGETLSEIAEEYGVSLRSLRQANKLKSDRINVGTELTIPGSTLAASGS